MNCPALVPVATFMLYKWHKTLSAISGKNDAEMQPVRKQPTEN